MIKTAKKSLKHKAQALIEAPVAFLIAFLIFIFIVEFALYFKSIHSNQTFADDVGANIAFLNKETLCLEPDGETLELIENRARKYLDNNINLDIEHQTRDLLVLKTANDDLTVNIICSGADGYIVRSEYFYRGFFALRFGHLISSISSVQTPKF